MLVVGEVHVEDLLEPRLHLGVLDVHQGFDAAVEVPLHEVGRADVVLDRLLARAAEGEDARVLQIAPDDRAHADVLGHARHARPQRAPGAHDEVDLRARE